MPHQQKFLTAKAWPASVRCRAKRRPSTFSGWKMSASPTCRATAMPVRRGHAQRFRQDHHRLRAQMREDALPVRAGGHPARTPEDRPALHRDAGHERHSVRHRLHQGRQALQDAVRQERGALQGHAGRAMGGTAADVRLVGRTRYGTRGDPRLHRRMPRCLTDC